MLGYGGARSLASGNLFCYIPLPPMINLVGHCYHYADGLISVIRPVLWFIHYIGRVLTDKYGATWWCPLEPLLDQNGKPIVPKPVCVSSSFVCSGGDECVAGNTFPRSVTDHSGSICPYSAAKFISNRFLILPLPITHVHCTMRLAVLFSSVALSATVAYWLHHYHH